MTTPGTDKKKVPNRELIGYFCQLYIRNVGERYLISAGRDNKLFSELLKVYPVDRLKQLLDLYFEKPEKIKSPVFFRARINDLVQIDCKRHPKRPKLIRDMRFNS